MRRHVPDRGRGELGAQRRGEGRILGRKLCERVRLPPCDAAPDLAAPLIDLVGLGEPRPQRACCRRVEPALEEFGKGRERLHGCEAVLRRRIRLVEPVAAFVLDLAGRQLRHEEVRRACLDVHDEHRVQRLVARQVVEVVILSEAHAGNWRAPAEQDQRARVWRLRAQDVHEPGAPGREFLRRVAKAFGGEPAARDEDQAERNDYPDLLGVGAWKLEVVTPSASRTPTLLPRRDVRP